MFVELAVKLAFRTPCKEQHDNCPNYCIGNNECTCVNQKNGQLEGYPGIYKIAERIRYVQGRKMYKQGFCN